MINTSKSLFTTRLSFFFPCPLNNNKKELNGQMGLTAIAGHTVTRFSASWSTTSSSTLFFSRIRRGLLGTLPTRKQQRQQQKNYKIMSSSASSSLPEVAAKQDQIAAPYGSWKSPITADVVSGASKRLGGTAVDSRGRLIWLESRPSESGYLYLYRFMYNCFICSNPNWISAKLRGNWIFFFISLSIFDL